MEQYLRIYRNHTKACTRGYTKPLFEDDQKKLQDCSCVLNLTGYLRNVVDGTGKPKRIQHHSLKTNSWAEAERQREEMLVWGQLTAPATGIELLQGDKVTVEDAVKFFFECGTNDGTKGRNTTVKYHQLLQTRLLPWCKAQSNPIRLLKRFDDPATVRAFFNSWRKRKNVDNNVCLEVNQQLAPNTKRACLERYRTFLTFCKDNGWLQANHAKKIKVSTADVSQKYAWTLEEYERILQTLEHWTDEYGREGQPEAIRQHAYFLTLRYTGQRISDVSMLGPDNLTEEKGNWFLSLIQVKTGNFVKIPVPVKLVQRLQSLPLRGETKEPHNLKTGTRTVNCGTKFWFWSAQSDPYNNSKEWGEHIAAVLKQTQLNFGKFAHTSSAHTARHFFAITMLSAGVPIEQVAKWLGHSSPLITARHYSHANADWHQNSHAAYMKALNAIEPTPEKNGKIVPMRKKTG
jgi:integrase